jgi:hypothetical protein
MRGGVGLAVLLLWGGVTPPAFGQIKLEWKFKEGDRFFVESVVAEKQSVETMGQTLSGDLSQTKLWSFTVRQAGETPVLEQRLEKWVLKGNPQFGRLPPRVPEKLQGVTFTLALTPAGQVSRFEGYAEVLKRLDAENPLLAKLWRPVLSEDAFRYEAEKVLNVLPEKAVAPGGAWERTTALPLAPFGAFRVGHRFTYRGKEKQFERIEDAASLTYVPPKGDIGGLPIRVLKGDFKTEGMKRSLLFDAVRGRLVHAEAKLSFRGTLTVEGDGNRAELRLEVRHSDTTRVRDKMP